MESKRKGKPLILGTVAEPGSVSLRLVSPRKSPCPFLEWAGKRWVSVPWNQLTVCVWKLAPKDSTEANIGTGAIGHFVLLESKAAASLQPSVRTPELLWVGKKLSGRDQCAFIRAHAHLHAYTQAHTLEDIMTVEQLRVYFNMQPLGGSVPPPIWCNQWLSWAQWACP